MSRPQGTITHKIPERASPVQRGPQGPNTGKLTLQTASPFSNPLIPTYSSIIDDINKVDLPHPQSFRRKVSGLSKTRTHSSYNSNATDLAQILHIGHHDRRGCQRRYISSFPKKDCKLPRSCRSGSSSITSSSISKRGLHYRLCRHPLDGYS